VNLSHLRHAELEEALSILLDGIEGAARAGADGELLAALRDIERGKPATPLLADRRPLAWKLVLIRVVSILERFYGLEPRDLGCPTCGGRLMCAACNGRKGGHPRGTHTPEEREKARASAALARAARRARIEARKGQGEGVP